MANIAIDFKKKQQVQVIVLVALVSVFVLYVYFAYLLKPQVTRVFGTLIKASKIRAELRAVESDVAKIDDFKNEIASYKGKIDTYEKRLPAEQEIPGFLEDISNMAKASGIKIVGITPIATAAKKDEKKQADQIYQEIPIIISARSGYHELGRFLSSLENSERFTKVVDLEIKSGDTPKKHDVEIVVLTYILLKGK